MNSVQFNYLLNAYYVLGMLGDIKIKLFFFLKHSIYKDLLLFFSIAKLSYKMHTHTYTHMASDFFYSFFLKEGSVCVCTYTQAYFTFKHVKNACYTRSLHLL